MYTQVLIHSSWIAANLVESIMRMEIVKFLVVLLWAVMVGECGVVRCGGERCVCIPTANTISCQEENLVEIPRFSDSELRGMNVLLLIRNKIRHITRMDLEILDRFNTVDLRENPLDCLKFPLDTKAQVLSDCDTTTVSFSREDVPTEDGTDDQEESTWSVSIILTVGGVTISVCGSLVFGLVNTRIFIQIRAMYRQLTNAMQRAGAHDLGGGQDEFEEGPPPQPELFGHEMEEEDRDRIQTIADRVRARHAQRYGVQRPRRRCNIT